MKKVIFGFIGLLGLILFGFISLIEPVSAKSQNLHWSKDELQREISGVVIANNRYPELGNDRSVMLIKTNNGELIKLRSYKDTTNDIFSYAQKNDTVRIIIERKPVLAKSEINRILYSNDISMCTCHIESFIINNITVYTKN